MLDKHVYIGLLVVIGILMPEYAFGYRPFVSTDASVVNEHKWDFEVGAFKWIHNDKQDTIITPSIRANYGIRRDWEVVGESDVQIYKEGDDRNQEIVDPALSLKGVLHEGILQDKEGPSLAAEFGLLLPSTAEGERRTGLSGIGILSCKLLDSIFHLNAGMELDRSNFKPNAIWGIILEYPLDGKFRMVGELNGTAKSQKRPDNSGLIGFIYRVGEVDLDFGLRKGFSDEASDWELTTGVTF